MITLITWIFNAAENVMSKWMAFIDPVCNPDWISGCVAICSLFCLFLMFRADYKNYGDKCWDIEGPELVLGVLAGAVMTLFLYCIPAILMVVLATLLLWGFLSILRFLVIISVKGATHE